MSLIQDKLKELERYKPSVGNPKDFKEFWLENLKNDNQSLPHLELKELAYPLPQVKVFEASMRAGDGILLKGYYLCPRSAVHESEDRLPGLIRYHGYSGNRGQISELLFWALQGYAILGLDVRGQCGETPDGRVYASGGFSGWMTLGLDSPQNHYLRQVYLDAARAVEALSRQPEVDEQRIGVFGKSQGGGLAIVAAALVNTLGKEAGRQAQVKAVSAAIPFLADFRGAYTLHTDGPMAELEWYFRLFDPTHEREEQIFEVLDYFDAVNFAPWVGENTKILVSVGLKDTTCPPPTIHALYQAITGQKKLLVYPEYGHESLDGFVERQIEFLAGELI